MVPLNKWGFLQRRGKGSENREKCKKNNGKNTLFGKKQAENAFFLLFLSMFHFFLLTLHPLLTKWRRKTALMPPEATVFKLNGQSCTASSLGIPQDGNIARVLGCSGAIQTAAHPPL
jgi:hypothetical protein